MSPRERRAPRQVARRFMADRRGAIMAEYVVLLSTVTIAWAVAILALGPSLIAGYERSQGILLSPFP
ncbi:MAG: hypothetical protein H6717_22335 [Polyangiaceae bacterium]|nr:hypothetical protein [Polyangiaceae bacterium]